MHIFEKFQNRDLKESFEHAHAKKLRFWSVNKKRQPIFRDPPKKGIKPGVPTDFRSKGSIFGPFFCVRYKGGLYYIYLPKTPPNVFIAHAIVAQKLS